MTNFILLEDRESVLNVDQIVDIKLASDDNRSKPALATMVDGREFFLTKADLDRIVGTNELERYSQTDFNADVM